MKRLILLLIFSAAVCFSGCTRDYPSDIPQWLKNCISEFKRTGKCNKVNLNSCMYAAGILIEECQESTTGSTLYRFVTIDPGTYYYYTQDGTPVCMADAQFANEPCGAYLTKNIYFTRRIWRAKGCE